MFCVGHDVRGVLFDFRLVILLRDGLGHPQDLLHRVVDLMGHAGDQRAEAGQLLGLNQLILKLFFLGDVPEDNPGLVWLFLADFYREEVVLVHAFLHLKLAIRLPAGGLCRDGLDLIHQRIPPGLSQRQDVIHRASDQSSTRGAEMLFGQRIGVGHPPILVDDQDRSGEAGQNLLYPVVGGPQGSLRLLAIGCILGNPRYPIGLS